MDNPREFADALGALWSTHERAQRKLFRVLSSLGLIVDRIARWIL
jgi:hypothetical protein